MAVGKVAMAHGKSAGVICPHAGVWAFTLKNHSLHSLPRNASSIFPAKPKPTVVMDGSVVFGHAQWETMGNPSNQWPTNGIPRPFPSPNLSTVIEVGGVAKPFHVCEAALADCLILGEVPCKVHWPNRPSRAQTQWLCHHSL